METESTLVNTVSISIPTLVEKLRRDIQERQRVERVLTQGNYKHPWESRQGHDLIRPAGEGVLASAVFGLVGECRTGAIWGLAGLNFRQRSESLKV